jgi:hypothetical protein
MKKVEKYPKKEREKKRGPTQGEMKKKHKRKNEMKKPTQCYTVSNLLEPTVKSVTTLRI